MNDVDTLVKVGAEAIGFDMKNLDTDTHGILSHIKVELLFLALLLFILYIPVEVLMNNIFKTTFGMMWRIVVGVTLFFIVRRINYFKSL